MIIPVINPNNPVGHDLIVQSGNPGGGGGGSASLNLGGGSLTIQAGIFRMNVAQAAVVSDGAVVISNGRLVAQFLSNVPVTISSGTLELHGGGNPLNGSSVALVNSSDGMILFKGETITDIASEHLGKVTVNGAAAVASGPGQNVVISSGPDGVFLTPGNATPPGSDDDQAAGTGAAILIPVLENDLDDGLPSPLSVDSVGSPLHGEAIIAGDQIRYTPNAGFYGMDQFSYTVTDEEFFSSATVTVRTSYSGPDLWIPLDECFGTMVHEAGGLELGAMDSFENPEAARVDGVFGKALEFDGVNDQVALSGVPLSNLPVEDAPRTIMAWIKTDNASEVSTIFSYGANTNGRRFSFRTNASSGNPTDHRVRLEVQGGFIVGTTNLNDGQWHHVAAVCDDFNNDGALNVNETRLYVDGEQEEIVNSASRGMETEAGTIAILGGSGHSTNYNFSGSIDNLRLFSEALTAGQIQTISDQPHQDTLAWHRANFGPDPVNWMEDSDGDGLNRLAEYAFGGNPRVRDETAPVNASYDEDSGKLRATFPRRISGNGSLSYWPEASRDLINWNTLAMTEAGAAPQAGTDCFEIVSVQLAENYLTEPVQFFRVRISLAP